MHQWIKTSFLTAVYLAAAAADLPAADQDETWMETVVVTGTRTEQALQKTPANVTVIDAEQIAEAGAANVPELLRSQEGLTVRDLYGNGKTAQVDLRGFGETGAYNTLVLVDGRRVNEIDLSGVDWTQIPLDQIERIEIVRGSGSVMYGDNAVGGVINIITKTPGKGLQGSAGAAAGSYGRQKGWARAGGGTEDLAVFLSAGYDSTNGYRQNGALRTRDIGGKLVYDPTPFLSLNLSGSYHSDDYGLPGPLTPEQYAGDPRMTGAPFDGAENRDHYLKLGSMLELPGRGRLEADLAYRYRDTEEDFISYTFSAERKLDTWSFTPRYVLDQPMGGRANTLVAGVDIYNSEMDMDTFYGEPRAPSNRSNVVRDSYGFYLHDDFSVMPKLILSLGARHEKVEYDLKQEDLTGWLAPLDDKVKSDENAWSTGLTYLYRDNSSLFVRANRSFRFPLTDELVVYDFVDGTISVNPNLQPQRGDHLETGLRHYFGPRLEANLTLFYAKIKDEIFFNKATFTNENHPETLHRGLELGGKLRPHEHLTLYANYTYQKATFEKEPFAGRDVPAVPRHRANLGLRLRDIFPGLMLAADYTYTGGSFAISDQANEFPEQSSYYTVDARVSYTWGGIKTFVGVNNLTNQSFAEYVVIGGWPSVPNYYPAPDRNWLFGLEYNF